LNPFRKQVTRPADVALVVAAVAVCVALVLWALFA